MQIDLTDMLRGDKTRINFEFDLPSPESFRDIVFPENMKVSGYVNDAAGYMTLVAVSDITLTTHCARCAKEIHPIHHLSLERELALKLEDEHNDDYLLIKGKCIDLDEEIREELVLGLDFTYYCKEDCKGLCPICGKSLEDEECKCVKKEIDPRLAPLAKLLGDKKDN